MAHPEVADYVEFADQVLQHMFDKKDRHKVRQDAVNNTGCSPYSMPPPSTPPPPHSSLLATGASDPIDDLADVAMLRSRMS